MHATTPTERDPLLSPNASDPPDPKQRPGPLELSRASRYSILAGVWLATFLSSINMTLVPTMIPAISSEFNKSNQASWLGTAYLLATCTFTPLYGRLSNIMGRKGANQLAVFFAATGVLLCGCSQSMEMLIFARFIGGIGGGGIFTTSNIVISDMYTLRSRGLTQGMASVFNGLGMGLGGPFGGIITDWLGWRWAFLLQVPFMIISFILTGYNLNYVTPGKGKSTSEVLKRIDYGGSLTLLVAVGSCLVFLSTKYNDLLPWSDPTVFVPLALTFVFMVIFILIEIFVAREPVLAPALLRQRIPVFIGISNFLVALCNFSVTYFFPMFFQTVLLTSASTAGLHLMPNSVSMATGSLFAGWMMHKTGKYKLINVIFGFFPFLAAWFMSRMREDSNTVQLWLSIIPLGFGNAVVLQTMLIALLAHLPESQMAVGTGFGQLFRGIGQVGGVAISSAIFQWSLDRELRVRLMDRPNAEQLIKEIRQAAKLVNTLPPDLQRVARDSYAISLRKVFIFAAVATLLAYFVRLTIPEKDLDTRPVDPVPVGHRRARDEEDATLVASRPGSMAKKPTGSTLDSAAASDDETEDEREVPRKPLLKKRRFSGFESVDGGLDLEGNADGRNTRR